jgi:hypothetical protein
MYSDTIGLLKSFFSIIRSFISLSLSLSLSHSLSQKLIVCYGQLVLFVGFGEPKNLLYTSIVYLPPSPS